MSNSTVDLRPGKLNVKSTRGDTVALVVTVNEDEVPADLTGRTYTAQLRRTVSSTTAVDIDVDDTDGADGILVLRIDPEVTADLAGVYVWDLEQLDAGVVRTIFTGRWTVDRDVTREAGS